MQPQQNLCKVMAACGELIKHLPLGQQLRLLDVVECSGGVQQIGHAFPVRLVTRAWGTARNVGKSRQRGQP